MGMPVNNKSRRLAAIGTVAAALTAGFVMMIPGAGVLPQGLQLIRSGDNGPGPGDGDHNGQHGTGSRGSGAADNAVKPDAGGNAGVGGELHGVMPPICLSDGGGSCEKP